MGKVSGVDVLSLEVEFYVKFAFYFAAFVVSLIGLNLLTPLSVQQKPQREFF